MDSLDQRIVAALVANGRAPWRTIAAALDAPARSVVRRGSHLIERRALRIIALPAPAASGFTMHSFRLTTTPMRTSRVSDLLARDPRVSWLARLGSGPGLVGEFMVPRDDVTAAARICEAIDGITDYRIHAVQRYTRTASGWRPDVLSFEERRLVRAREERAGLVQHPTTADATSERLLQAMAHDGRATAQSLAVQLGVSKVTVAKWIDRALTEGHAYVRGVVSPAVLGYDTEVVVSLAPALTDLDAVAEAVAAIPGTRVCAIAGMRVIANLATRSVDEVEAALRPIARAFPSLPLPDVDVIRETPVRSCVRFDGTTPGALVLPHHSLEG